MAPNLPTSNPPPPPAPPANISKKVPSQPKLTDKPNTTTTTKIITAEQEFVEARKQLWELEGWKERPLLTVYRYLPSILQDGPQCGLVALAMAAASSENPVSVADLLHEAQFRGFSYNGEMFSVDNMADLARSVLPRSEICIVEGLSEHREFVLQHLARGGVLLVPYDADRNHSPCCLRGHKAHWAAVSGALVCSHGCLVAARQGKSRRLMLWDYSQLAASNDNLLELSPKRSEDGNEYLLPAGGVEAGLCGRAVLLQHL